MLLHNAESYTINIHSAVLKWLLWHGLRIFDVCIQRPGSRPRFTLGPVTRRMTATDIFWLSCLAGHWSPHVLINMQSSYERVHLARLIFSYSLASRPCMFWAGKLECTSSLSARAIVEVRMCTQTTSLK